MPTTREAKAESLPMITSQRSSMAVAAITASTGDNPVLARTRAACWATDGAVVEELVQCLMECCTIDAWDIPQLVLWAGAVWAFPKTIYYLTCVLVSGNQVLELLFPLVAFPASSFLRDVAINLFHSLAGPPPEASPEIVHPVCWLSEHDDAVLDAFDGQFVTWLETKRADDLPGYGDLVFARQGCSGHRYLPGRSRRVTKDTKGIVKDTRFAVKSL